MTTRAFATGILLVSAMAAQQFSYSNSGGSLLNNNLYNRS